MGYTTYFNGEFSIRKAITNKPISNELKRYINKFSETRRMMRDNDKIMECFPNWKELCFNGELGNNGEYFIGGDGFCGQKSDTSIINYNAAGAQPGLWCQWIVNNNSELVWDEGEKFYNYVEWLEYLIKHFFEPEGYVLNGEVTYEGEDYDDFGVIICKDNHVENKVGIHAYDLKSIDTDRLIDEINSRGYHVTK